jgi:hypothetical protein
MHAQPSRRDVLQTLSAGGLYWAVGGASLLLPRSTAAASDRRHAQAIARITRLAAASEIASYAWKNRGRAPAGYIKGMAVSYARLHYALSRGDAYAREMARAAGEDATKDALKHYEDIFAEAGMDNSKDGPDTLRHLFVLMLGAGMRESSGKHCEGRDRSAQNTSAETAEAGLFQTSYNARRGHPLLPKLFEEFRAKPEPSYLEIFAEGVRCRDTSLENFGEGDGREFQKLSKECPFFAVAFTAIGMRNLRRHWGPINRRDAEVRPAANAMFKEVQKLVDRDKLGPHL